MPILGQEIALYPENLLSGDPLPGANARRWWVVYTKARQEKAFTRQLYSFNVPFYLPLVPKTNLIRGRRIQSFIPLFGGYVFVYGDENERVKSLTTNRVSSILAVKDQEQLRHDLRQIAQLIDSDAPLTVESRLSAGDRVRVRKGPLAGVEGTVICRRGRMRLLVAVTMLQQGVSVEIEDFLLEPI